MTGHERWVVPLSRPEVDEHAIDEVVEVLRGPILSGGPCLASFERAFAAYIGASSAVGVSSGTAGLHLAVRVLDLEPGDEVITSPFSFIASANCLLFEHVTPVFVDIDPDTFVIDANGIEAVATPRTRSLLPVHVFGNPVDMRRITKLAAARGWTVIEDACEAIGGGLDGRRLGSWGDLGVFGFYPNKQMTTGEGGMIVTSRDELVERLRSLRNQGRSPSGDGSFSELGYNYRMSELTASLGESQLRRLDTFLEARRGVERRYCEQLADVEEVRVPPIPPGRSPFVFVIQTREAALRDFLRRHLEARGVQSAIYFRPIHLEPFYRERFGFREGRYPRCEAAASTCLALPFHNRLGEADQDRVVDAVKEGVGVWLRERACVSGSVV